MRIRLGYVAIALNLDKVTSSSTLTYSRYLKMDEENRLKKLVEVGLGYMTLGQTTNTLSGGENQRLKLADELNKEGNIYILDEPATGLHEHDVNGLSHLLNRLVESGNTVIIIEHRLELISKADWIIDMGPEGGHNGGKILFEGTPEMILKAHDSMTAKHLLMNISDTTGDVVNDQINSK